MFPFPKATGKILTAIAAFSLIAFTIGGMALFNLFHIRSHAEKLTHLSLPQWAVAHEIQQEVAQIGYFMLAYGLLMEPQWWEKARLSMESCATTLQKGLRLARKNNLPEFQNQLLEMEKTLADYHQALMQARKAAESTLENRSIVERASLVFIQNIQAYIEMQHGDMDLQIRSVFARTPLMRGELNLATEEELRIRQERLQASTQILNTGRSIYEILLKADVQRKVVRLQDLAVKIEEARRDLHTLLAVTRQEPNRQQLQAALTALEDNARAVASLAMARQAAEKAHLGHTRAYENLLHLAKNISSHAHDSALYGGNRTQAIAENFVKLLIPLALAGIWILIVLHARISSLERQSLEMTQLSRLAQSLRQAKDVSEATACTLEACKRLFSKDAGILALMDPGPTLRLIQTWGNHPPDVPPPGTEEEGSSASSRDFYIPICPPEGQEALLGIRLHPSSLFMGQRDAVRKALARNVADHFSAGLNTLHLMHRLRQESITDALTGLYNRRYMEETLRREFSRCQRKGICLSLLLLDADHFKKVNDNHGHEAGDGVLIHLAALLKKDIRAEDVACRFGGEEFLLLMPGLCPKAAMAKAELLRLAVLNTPTRLGDNRVIPLTVSIGLAVYPEDALTPEALIRAADQGLYAAKSSGRNRVSRVLPRTSTGNGDLPHPGGEKI
jgi:diguanylate cyclase (GGDEF)-like protein